jgi:glutamate--cysteine ligase
VELESFAVPHLDPSQLPAPPLPAGSRLTFEPGGQVEVSSPPGRTVAEACATLSTDLEALREAFLPCGVRLVQEGLQPDPPQRCVESPRYQAMEAYFDRRWPGPGRAMMCGTASVQVNLGLGTAARGARRWRGANVLGPALAAAFSSSPDGQGRGSRRLATWLALDPSRTAPVAWGGDPRRAWADYALAAEVMLIRTDSGVAGLTGEALTARAWIEEGHDLGWPTADDLEYHLTTLFPPVRPRGWLELRMIDALPDPWWRVPVAVAAALVDDDTAVVACEDAADRWWEAASDGLGDAAVAEAVTVCAERCGPRLARVGTDGATTALVEQWANTVRKGCEPPWL